MSDIYAIVKKGIVSNTVMWDGVSDWKPDSGKMILIDETVGIGWVFDGEKFTPPVVPELSAEEKMAISGQIKESLLDQAKAALIIWQTKLLLGRQLTDSETTKLNVWLDYIDKLNNIDIANFDITWPETPE